MTVSDTVKHCSLESALVVVNWWYSATKSCFILSNNNFETIYSDNYLRTKSELDFGFWIDEFDDDDWSYIEVINSVIVCLLIFQIVSIL